MSKKKAVFQPTVRPDWAGAMEYIPKEEQVKIFQAILMFPAIDVPESAFWNKTVKPDLQQQYESFVSSCQKKAIGICKRWEVAKSIDMNSNVIDMNSNEQDMIFIVKEKEKDKNKNIDNRVVGEEGRFVKPTLEDVLKYAKEQNQLVGMGGFSCSKQMAETFWSNYEANGWVLGNESKTPIRDWKAKLRQWALKDMSKSMSESGAIMPKQAKGER